MKSFGTVQQASVVSEWEDNVAFDSDDPDFSGDHGSSNAASSHPATVLNRSTTCFNIGVSHVPANLPRFLKVPSTMSVASVQAPHLTELCSSLSRTSLSLSSSLSDLVGSPSLTVVSSAAMAAAALEVSSEAVLTIEELRAQLGSCFTCGVSWTGDQMSLDCSECGGYSMERPCMLCDGICGQAWKRDFTMSHACSKARWQGVCAKFAAPIIPLQSAPLSSCASFSSHHQLMQSAQPVSTCHGTANQHFLQQELCARLEKLSAKAHN
ncbi:protein pinocchio [Malaya genurostris]|uniref:protein pinocchio n=1 Tax=Malaya genurostris TaxID=325434 RepID=UPI0026F39B10|nr:protein pinocchio [Malaya genurostris]